MRPYTTHTHYTHTRGHINGCRTEVRRTQSRVDTGTAQVSSGQLRASQVILESSRTVATCWTGENAGIWGETKRNKKQERDSPFFILILILNRVRDGFDTLFFSWRSSVKAEAGNGSVGGRKIPCTYALVCTGSLDLYRRLYVTSVGSVCV